MTSGNGLPTIKTFSGLTFDYANPTPAMIDPKDIAAALSKLCRFAGQSSEFYSVAQHSVLVSTLLEDGPHRKWGLLHDAAEAYMVDLPRPLKQLLPEYKVIENRVAKVIAERFDIEWPMPDEVDGADKVALAIEGISFMEGRDDEYNVVRLTEERRVYYRTHPVKGLLPRDAKISFILRAHQCFGPAFNWGLYEDRL